MSTDSASMVRVTAPAGDIPRNAIRANVSLYHGGRPRLRVGDTITADLGGRPAHDGCPICAQRDQQAAGALPSDLMLMDGLPVHRDQVYATTNRLYARFHASLWGRGWVYRVSPIGALTRSTEDSIESFHAAGWIIESVLERAVLLTWSERRRLSREWLAADVAVGWV